MAGMSLRGILWMTPVGLGMNTGGYGRLMVLPQYVNDSFMQS
jgi:hypothetical protein